MNRSLGLSFSANEPACFAGLSSVLASLLLKIPAIAKFFFCTSVSILSVLRSSALGEYSRIWSPLHRIDPSSSLPCGEPNTVQAQPAHRLSFRLQQAPRAILCLGSGLWRLFRYATRLIDPSPNILVDLSHYRDKAIGSSST